MRNLLIAISGVQLDRSRGARYIVATIRTMNAAFPQWKAPVKVTLRDRGGVIDIVGIDRSGARARLGSTTNN